MDGGTCAGGGATLYSGVLVRGRIRSTRGIYSRLCSHRRVAAQATLPRSCAGHPNGLIADPRLHTKVCRGARSDIRVRPDIRVRSDIYSTPGICPGLCGLG